MEFEVVRLLGSGGMGQVHLAEQKSLGRLVALKVMDEALARDPVARKRFEREARLAATLDHPGIVPVYGVGELGGRPYIAMKWLPGPALDAVARPLPPADVARIGSAIARALEEAHACGVFHRDVKPGNVILDGDRPILVDFGLARSVPDRTLTGPVAVAGTLPYMAPEVLREGGPGLDARADVYGLGATLYELATGAPPFVDDSRGRLMHRILNEEPARLGLPAAARDLETIVLRAISKEPARRFPSAANFADDLDRFLRGEPIQSRPTGPLTRLAMRVRRHRRVSVALASLGAVVLISLGLAGSEAFRVRRAFAAASRNVELALEARDAEQARTNLLAVRPGWGNDDEAERLAGRVAQAGAVEALLDAVLDRGEQQDAAEIRALLEELRRLEEPLGDHGYWRSAAALARSTAYLHLEDRDAALREAEAAAGEGGRRAVEALRWYAARAAGSVPDGRVLDALDHVLPALTALWANRGIDEQLAALGDPGTVAGPEGFRVHFTRGLLLVEAGREEEARLVFEALRATGRKPRALARQLARIALRDGNAARAHEEIDRLGDARTAFELGLQLQLAVQERRHQDARTLLDRYPAWRDRRVVEWYRWQLESAAGKSAEATAILEALADDGTVPYYAENAKAALLLADCERLLSRDDRGGAFYEEQRGDLERSARQLAANLKSVSARARALHARALLVADDAPLEVRARAYLVAFDVDLRYWPAKANFVRFVAAPLCGIDVEHDRTTLMVAMEAISAAKEIAERASRTPGEIPPDMLFEVQQVRALLAEKLGRHEDATKAARGALDLVATHESLEGALAPGMRERLALLVERTKSEH